MGSPEDRETRTSSKEEQNQEKMGRLRKGPGSREGERARAGGNGVKRKGQAADKHSRRALWVLGGAIFMGFLVVILFACQTSSWATFWGVVSTGASLGGASLVVGGTLGFLFGVPRARSREERREQAAGEGGEKKEANGGSATGGVTVNTNLEDISDWLTKIIVGVGLTQMYKVPGQLKALTKYVAEGLVRVDKAEPFVISVAETFALGAIVYFLSMGFLFGYLWTRFVLTGALTKDAAEQLRGELEDQAKRTDALRERQAQEEATWKLVRRQLYTREDDVIVRQADLDAAVAEASSETKSRIFYEAARIRRETWQDDKARMARTIPIFTALCRADKNDKYHANHGQLGFALKDKANATAADLKEAEDELTKAIAMRDRARAGEVWPFYELCRAICRIRLGEAFVKRVGNRAVDEIKEDLRQAAMKPYLRNIIETDKRIQGWLKDNKVQDLEGGN